MRALLLAFSLFTFSCVQMVNRPTSSTDPYGPVRRAGGAEVGIVKYYTDGAAPLVEARKRDAYKQMHGACGGLYEIVSEGPEREGGSATVMDLPGPLPMTHGVSSPINTWVIHFRCITEESGATTGQTSYSYPPNSDTVAKIADGRRCPLGTATVGLDVGEPGVEAESCAYPDRDPPVLHGPFVAWWSDNGRAHSSGWYVNGAKDGEWTKHDGNGVPVERQRWSRGALRERRQIGSR